MPYRISLRYRATKKLALSGGSQSAESFMCKGILGFFMARLVVQSEEAPYRFQKEKALDCLIIASHCICQIRTHFASKISCICGAFQIDVDAAPYNLNHFSCRLAP